MTWGRIPLPSAQQNRMNSLPPAAAPWRGSFPRCARQGSALPWRGTGAGCRMRAGLGSAPTKGPESAGEIVQAPLKRGLSPPKAVTGGFSSPAGATERGGGRNPPSRLRRAASLFKGGFLRRPRTDGAQRRGRQGIGQTRKPPPRTPSSRPSAGSPAPHPATMPGGMCQGRRTPRGRTAPVSARAGPSGPEWGTPRHSIPSRR